MARQTRLPPSQVDALIIGNGPSALILSFILHGNIPYYNATKPHPDPILHSKLCKTPCLLDLDVENLTNHFSASRLSYSTQALPVNVLLDTLLRPLADTEPGQVRSCVEWRHEPEKAVSHAVFGDSASTGGQWADNPVHASLDIGTLSYAEMLSLPGYSFPEHYRLLHGKTLPEFRRPTRREVAKYLAVYPTKVGISDAIYTSSRVKDISRRPDGFYVHSHDVSCKHLILASGIFSQPRSPRKLLQPLLDLESPSDPSKAILVVGSGFTAADVILSMPLHQQIIHIFKWSPEKRPSPLRACHPQAYPEYAGIYRRMKIAAMNADGNRNAFSPLRRRKSNPFFGERDWETVYEGFPNTIIESVSMQEDEALVNLSTSDGRRFSRKVGGLEYVVGRRGSLRYLDRDLQVEVLADIDDAINPDDVTPKVDEVWAQTLRAKVEKNLEVAPNVFVTGSLTGDSLIRFAFGGCAHAAGAIVRRNALLTRIGACTKGFERKENDSRARASVDRAVDESSQDKCSTNRKVRAYSKGKSSSNRRTCGHTDLGVHRAWQG